MARDQYPDEVAGLNVNHGPFPADFDASPITPAEEAFFDAEEKRDEWDSGYSDIMSTRPDTIAAALADSPAGLAAWMVDKSARGATATATWRRGSTATTICSVLTLYWATESIGTSSGSTWITHATARGPSSPFRSP